MTGLVLAAGAGRRLRPYTDTLPERGFTVDVPQVDVAQVDVAQVDVAPVGNVTWVETDNHDGLARGRGITCRY